VAGGILATYYWFSQTSLYNQTVLSDLPWPFNIRILMAGLSFLMISNVPYPAVPTFSIRTVRGVLGLVLFIGLALGLIFLPKDFFFPVGMLYVAYGVVASVVKGLLDRPQFAEEEEIVDDEKLLDDEDIEPVPQLQGNALARKRRRRFRGPRNKPDRLPPQEPTA
jgi:CDP-diacylglycerol--serine O-phosphatidyltransferase